MPRDPGAPPRSGTATTPALLPETGAEDDPRARERGTSTRQRVRDFLRQHWGRIKLPLGIALLVGAVYAAIEGETAAAVGGIGALLLFVVDYLLSIDEKLEAQRPAIDDLRRATREIEGLYGESYENLNAASPVIRTLIATTTRCEVKVIAATAESLVGSLLKDPDYPRGVHLKVQVIDPAFDFTCADRLPKRWKGETQAALDFLHELAHDTTHFTVDCWTYRHLPCIHGIMINDEHLFLGFFQWMKRPMGEELVGAQRPYSYFRYNEHSRPQFELFNSWFDAPVCTRHVMRSKD